MVYDQKGFLIPKLGRSNQLAINALIKQACPGYGLSYSPKKTLQHYHVLWGPYIKVRKGYSLDTRIREEASSGGIITSLLHMSLKENLVDYIIQIGPSHTDPTKNEVYLHSHIQNLVQFSGSRYSPASPLIMIDKVLKTSGKFLFVGRPCDIAALRAYAKINQQINDKIRYYVSFFCAGTPSIKGTEQIINDFGIQKEDVIKLKYRGDGWPGRFSIVTKNGQSLSLSYEQSWGQILNKYLHTRCKICPDGVGQLADVVCADAWDSNGRGYPTFKNQQGQSIIISRTKTGENLVKLAQEKAYITFTPYDLKTLHSIQPYQAKRKKQVFSRLLAMKLFGLQIPKYDNIGIVKAALSENFLNNLASFIGMLKRSLAIKRRYESSF